MRAPRRWVPSSQSFPPGTSTKAVRRLAFACGLALLLASCARPPNAPIASRDPERPLRGGTLRVLGTSDVDHLFTVSAYLDYAQGLVQTFARQLVIFRQEGDYEAKLSLVPDVAETVPTRENGGISPDGRHYAFHLKRRVRWNSSPPREVTAHDFVRAFKLFCNPVSPVGAPGYYTRTIAGMAQYCETFTKVPGTVEEIRRFVATHEIEGVRAVDDATLVFDLVAPAPDFLKLLALPFASAVPAEYLDHLLDGPEFRQHTLSNGPYAISRSLSYNYGGYDSPVVNAAIDRALSAPTADLAESAWAEAASRVVADRAIVPLVERRSALMRSSRVRNASWAPINNYINPLTLWLEDAHADH